MDIARHMKNAGSTLKNEGPVSFAKKTRYFVGSRYRKHLRKHQCKAGNMFCDVLFINGCSASLPHPIRYRIDHQIEQLRSCGLTADRVEADEVTLDTARNARAFVIFRCPYTDAIGEFIARAKAINKLVLYDIDDLVIDTVYTDSIPHIAAMDERSRSSYDDGVRRMGETLKLCDGAITTTEALAEELRKYVPYAFINRNTVSNRMVELSEKALSAKQASSASTASQMALKETMASDGTDAPCVRLGYFSGSITHNDDFEMILPAIVHALESFPYVRLTIVGELDLPHELKPFTDRIDTLPFIKWTALPAAICEVDINLAPLRNTLFNRAKSEIKWIEAALVKVPTIASNTGSFARMIEPGRTGILCATPEEWTEKLSVLINSPETRQRIGNAAYDFCCKNCVTIGTGQPLVRFLREKWAPNIAFALPSLKTSGGIVVILKHCEMLQAAGYDAVLLDRNNDFRWIESDGHFLPVLNREAPNHQIESSPLIGSFDQGVATLWDTLKFLKRYPNVERVSYLVQNYETDFYLPGNWRRIDAEATYCDEGVEYLTISKWCSDWLRNQYGHVVRYAPNGIDCEIFHPTQRSFSGKTRILIEGDCESEYKNVDESFAITNQLDPEQFEIWYMSYSANSKPFYRIDRNLGAVPHEEVAEIYRQCDILIKTSILESFSYPPLEMMATGGFVVALPNEGNLEYLKDGVNCLTYDRGDTKAAMDAIYRICNEPALRQTLYENGLATARSHDWRTVEDDILALYQ